MMIARNRLPVTVALCVFVSAIGAADAATLAFAGSLYLEPDARTPVVATLPAGTSVAPLVRQELAAQGIEDLPSGWVAVHYTGPIHGYVLDADIRKDLSAKPGAVVRIAPLPDARIVTMVEEKDKAEMTAAPEEEWAKVVLQKDLVLFLDLVPASARPGHAGAQATPSAKPVEPPIGAIEQPAPAGPVEISPTPNEPEATPRVFEGTLGRTRRILGRGPKLDYQLLDESNRRIALLDMSALLITEPLEHYEGHFVSVFGTGTTKPELGGLIIRVESLRLVR